MHVELLAPRLNLTEGSFNTAVMCRQRGNSWSNDCHHLLCALPMSIYLQTQQDYSTKNNTFQKQKQHKELNILKTNNHDGNFENRRHLGIMIAIVYCVLFLY